MTIEEFCNKVEILIYNFKPEYAPDEQGEITWDLGSKGYSINLDIPQEWFKVSDDKYYRE